MKLSALYLRLSAEELVVLEQAGNFVQRQSIGGSKIPLRSETWIGTQTERTARSRLDPWLTMNWIFTINSDSNVAH